MKPRLPLQTDPKASRSFLEGLLASLKNVAHGFANTGVFKPTCNITDWRQTPCPASLPARDCFRRVFAPKVLPLLRPGSPLWDADLLALTSRESLCPRLAARSLALVSALFGFPLWASDIRLRDSALWIDLRVRELGLPVKDAILLSSVPLEIVRHQPFLEESALYVQFLTLANLTQMTPNSFGKAVNSISSISDVERSLTELAIIPNPISFIESWTEVLSWSIFLRCHH